VIPPQFEYQVASTVPEAVAVLQGRSDARLLAGGQSLIPVLKARRAHPGLLVDIGRIPGLRGITISNDTVEIGPLTTHREIEDSVELRRVMPIMAEAADLVADPPVRSRGTFGGSLAYADPGGDWPAVALALDGRVEATGPAGTRTIALDDFFVGELQTALQHDEILTRITIPIPPQPAGMAYLKLRHPSSGYALVGVAAVVELDRDRVCQSCRVAVTGVGPSAAIAEATCKALVGQPLTPDTIRAAAQQAAVGLSLSSDIYAGEEYRAHLVRVYVERALLAASQKLSP
jgi:aerobic carbon-monoxide dehydrogenase medium subunit